MKKTIAKIMAAAMVLSAVPAVAMPSMTAEAAAPTAVTISGVKTATRELESNGSTKIKITQAAGATTNVSETFTAWGTVTKGDTSNVAGGYTISGSAKDYVSKVAIDSDGYVVVSLGDADAELVKLIKAGTNTITIKATLNNVTTVNMTADDDPYKESASGTAVMTLGTFYVGGAASDTSSSTPNYDATDKDGFINAGEIGVVIEADGTAEIVKGQAGSNIKDNDDLRGQLLDLNTVNVAGVSYKVTKVGAQALKEAHMKKLDIENTKTIGKGALRKCKQVTKIDASDANKVRKIHSKAFYGDKNLKTISIDGRKLKTVGSNAFNGVKKNCTIKIKAKKSKFESDKKMILKNGGNKNLKFVRKAP
ncbi:MAG: leucine-rich repeat protein [Lachnospiraceae bacterium]|nr:leucine-rich repeat protein [Lachnospiraceae bacterium]